MPSQKPTLKCQPSLKAPRPAPNAAACCTRYPAGCPFARCRSAPSGWLWMKKPFSTTSCSTMAYGFETGLKYPT